MRPLVGLGVHETPARSGASRCSRRGDGSSSRSPMGAARTRLRGPPLGRRRAARLRRPPRRLGEKRAACRSSALHAPSSTSSALVGAAGGQTPRRSRYRRCREMRRGCSSHTYSGTARRRRRSSARSSRTPRQPVLRGGVRPDAARPRSAEAEWCRVEARRQWAAAPGVRAGHHRLAPRRPRAGGQGPAPGRGRARPHVSGLRRLRRSAATSRRRSSGACTRSSGRSSSSAYARRR